MLEIALLSLNMSQKHCTKSMGSNSAEENYRPVKNHKMARFRTKSVLCQKYYVNMVKLKRATHKQLLQYF